MVRWGRRERRERREQMENQGLQVQRGLVVGLPVLREQRVLKGLLDLKVPWVLRGLRVLRGP